MVLLECLGDNGGKIKMEEEEICINCFYYKHEIDCPVPFEKQGSLSSQGTFKCPFWIDEIHYIGEKEMKRNKVEEVQLLLAEKGIKVAESVIIEAAMNIILCVSDGVDALEEQLELTRLEQEYKKNRKKKTLGRSDSV